MLKLGVGVGRPQPLELYIPFEVFSAAAKAADTPLYGESAGYFWRAIPGVGTTLLFGLWSVTATDHHTAVCRAASELEAIAARLDHSDKELVSSLAAFVRNSRKLVSSHEARLEKRLARALETIERWQAKPSSPTGEER